MSSCIPCSFWWPPPKFPPKGFPHCSVCHLKTVVTKYNTWSSGVSHQSIFVQSGYLHTFSERLHFHFGSFVWEKTHHGWRCQSTTSARVCFTHLSGMEFNTADRLLSLVEYWVPGAKKLTRLCWWRVRRDKSPITVAGCGGFWKTTGHNEGICQSS